MRVAIVENMPFTQHGLVGVALREAGAAIEVIRAFAGEPLPADIHDHDALVVFGGEQNARDDHIHPYLPALAGVMKNFGEAGKAVLGICLGSQVLARAYGGENLIGAAPEFGWRDIMLADGARSDPVLSHLGRQFVSFQWHDDTFTLPQGATRLAENDIAQNQGFRIGRAAYGMQFHFEADHPVVEEWIRLFPAHVERKAPGWLARHPEHAARHAAKADASGLEIARAWVRQI
ncbi:MAG TPA: type 1 glutamine amidotransferase [Rhizobium sp.]|nr:type 1 glutamine amidotransferase [Rhizobium sp.]